MKPYSSNSILRSFDGFFEKYLQNFVLFSLRILISKVFWDNGIANINDLDATILHFEYEYKLPIINPAFAVYSLTFFEIICSTCLVLGIFTRISSLPLIFITLIIEFFIFSSVIHLYWLAILATIFAFGSGKICLGEIVKLIARIFKVKKI